MKPYYTDDSVTLYHGDALMVARTLADDVVDCIVTSPPYFGLRDYGIDGQYGLEASPAEYVETMRALFSELRRVLADDGTLWLNIGDSYAGGLHRCDYGLPQKSLMLIPWRVAQALQDEGWILRNAVVWNKSNAMPEKVYDRLSNKYEPIFMFSKSRSYWFDLDPIRKIPTTSGGKTWEQRKAGGELPVPHGLQGAAARGVGGFKAHEAGANPGDVWDIPTQSFKAAHFAVFPTQLAQRCIMVGCKPGGTVLDPFSGSGTTGLAAQRLGRKYIGIDLNVEYLDLSMQTRLAQSALDFGDTA